VGVSSSQLRNTCREKHFVHTAETKSTSTYYRITRKFYTIA